MSNWPQFEPVRVSVCCITYKQKQYISQAIDSFLVQKTSFPFEIIIGDDNGNDGTLEILLAYQARYPKIIKIVYSNLNVGANKNLMRVFYLAKGKYIAVCEGDDYWCESNKLQYQLDILEADPSISICVHSAKLLKNNLLCDGFKIPSEKEFFSAYDVLLTNKQFSPTASYFFRKEVINQLPDWFQSAPIGDFFIEIYALSIGRGCYLNKSMSVYRVSAENSWSSHIKKDFYKFTNTQDRIVEYTCKILFDFPEFKDLIARRVSLIYLDVIKRSILSKNDELLDMYLHKYRMHSPEHGFSEHILMMLFKLPTLLRLVNKVKKYFSRSYW
ncbi:glycosyltransferase family 2 protein [Plesiomonas shigelloides]|uniref:glycosyltransferase family 2 protein n=1 Tax=Plesiomonas shigelloides TaxID=703 RepID=UPI0032602052